MNLFSRLEELKELVLKTQFTSLGESLSSEIAFAKIHHLLSQIKKSSKKVWVIGNGGSAGIASHHSVDLINVVKVPALTLTDSNLVTCMANDFGYEEVYARPLDLCIEKNDLLIAISSSGSSKNILNAVKLAQNKQAQVITLSGFKADNPLRGLGDINIFTEVSDYGLVESAHFFILHSIADTWKEFTE